MQNKVPNLIDFVDKYLGMKLPTNWHHRLYYDILTHRVVQNQDGKLCFNKFFNDKGEECSFDHPTAEPARTNKNILIMSPRFHAKSQAITINYVIWRLYKNPNTRVLIVSANEDIAIAFNRAIMNHLENNFTLTDELGSLVPEFADKQKWGERAIIVSRDTHEKDPSITALGVGGKLISRRADLIICDDVIDINTARTKLMRNKTREWFDNVLMPILEDDGQIVVVGTAWYKDDLYDQLLRNEGFDIRLKLRALMYHEKYLRTREYKDEKGRKTATNLIRYLPYQIHEYPFALKAQNIMTDEVVKHYNLYTKLKGGVIWEDKWSFAKLKAKLDTGMSKSAWNRQYLNEPTNEEDRVFLKHHIESMTALGEQKSLQPEWDNANPIFQTGYGNLIIAVGVDLAISKKSTADKTAIAVWGLDNKRRRILLWIDSGRWTPQETVHRITDVFYRYHPIKIRVENVAFQDMIRQQLDQDDIPVEGFHTTQGRKFNEETGIAQIAALAEQGKILIPTSKINLEYYERVKELLAQIETYSYDSHAGDLLMASWFALNSLNDYDRKLNSNRGFFDIHVMIKNVQRMKAPHRVVLLFGKTLAYKLSNNSLLYVYRPVTLPNQEFHKHFIDKDEEFMMFVTREARSVCYIFEKYTDEMVAKIEGDITVTALANLLERAGKFFNDAQIIIDRNDSGQALLLEMLRRRYSKLVCYQPDNENKTRAEYGFKINSANLPIAIDYFKSKVESEQIYIKDDALLKEMGEMIGVEGGTMKMSFGTGQRIKTAAVALWLLDNYENIDKKMYNSKKKRIKKRDKLYLPYAVFQADYGSY